MDGRIRHPYVQSCAVMSCCQAGLQGGAQEQSLWQSQSSSRHTRSFCFRQSLEPPLFAMLCSQPNKSRVQKSLQPTIRSKSNQSMSQQACCVHTKLTLSQLQSILASPFAMAVATEAPASISWQCLVKLCSELHTCCKLFTSSISQILF